MLILRTCPDQASKPKLVCEERVNSRLFELARMLVRLNHFASFVVHVNHSVTRAAIEFRGPDCLREASGSPYVPMLIAVA